MRKWSAWDSTPVPKEMINLLVAPPIVGKLADKCISHGGKIVA